MPGIPSRPDFQFVLFDALGLDPTDGPITVLSIQRAWRHVNLQTHPDKLATAKHIPVFPSYREAQKAKDYLLAEDKSGALPETRNQAALASGKAGYRSTWNPWATPNTELVLQPIPGAPKVKTHGPAPLGPDPRVPQPRSGGPDENESSVERRRNSWMWCREGSPLPDREGRRQWREEEARRERNLEEWRELPRPHRELELQRERMQREERWWMESEEESALPGGKGRRQWEKEEASRERHAERGRTLRRLQREREERRLQRERRREMRKREKERAAEKAEKEEEAAARKG
ncbi:hypothetical protein MMC34_001097 [Xylographa carneopallida]|nr:hypothetical protein [Xylographa carneopallida]